MSAYAPGRAEIAGNHTDHQGGCAIAATVDCGVEVVASPRDDMHAHVESEGFGVFDVDLRELGTREDEKGTTAALVRGMAAGLRCAGVEVRGFDAKVRSDVPAGGGLSSSAAFELALGQVLNALFADGRITASDLAVIGQQAERDHFGKPCGLLDQLSIALGGVNLFDFGACMKPEADDAKGASNFAGQPTSEGSPAPLNACAASLSREIASGASGGAPIPGIESVDFDLDAYGYVMFLVDTHCDHSEYGDEYARVAQDMCDVARYLGSDVLSGVSKGTFVARFQEVRAALGDLPALRALHFYNEMELVDVRARALKAGDFDAFLEATRRSGASSAQFLQNVSTFDRKSQPAMIALALAQLIGANGTAVRIYGGGFGGSVQAFVPKDAADGFAASMDALLGAGTCKPYRIVYEGAHIR
ncbi:MAG: galactokinase [Eggerthellaceae bacterium]|nr:galactokinase [Eggerthellaceae bacterium]